MAKVIKQFRYFKDNSKNQPATASVEDFETGEIFKDCYPIYQLGIQSLPGVYFRLNGDLNPIMTGSLGLYELDHEASIEITDIKFEQASMNYINNEDGFLIVDILCEEA